MRIRKSQKFPLKRVLLGIGLPLILLLSGAAAYDQFDKLRYHTASTFDQARWNRPDLKYRYSTTALVLRQVIKPGMTEGEVTEQLGTPNAVTGNEDWQYETQQPGLPSFSWTGGGILIKFDRDRRVIEAVDHTLVD